METARDPFDELTSLYLGDPVPRGTGGSPASLTTSESASPAASKVTVAVCGNLPVMAGLWVTQYADLEAAACGPTGLIRLEGGRCSIELLRAGRTSPPVDGEPMARAAAALVSRIRRWIVCVDDRDAAAAVRAGADEVVVLTSGDQAAVVEAFRLVKSARARAVDPAAVDVGVVIVGADEATASRAGATLEQMATRHLKRPLSTVATVRRLDVVDDSQRLAFDESLRGDAEEIVAALLAGLAAAPPPEAASTPPAAPILRLAEIDDDLPGFDGHADVLDLEVDPDEAALDAIFRSIDDDVDEDPTAMLGEVPSSPEPRPERPIDRTRQRPRIPSPVRLGPAPASRPGRPAFIGLDDLEELDRPVAADDAASRIGPRPHGTAADADASDRRPASPASGVEARPIVDLVDAIGGLRRIAWPFVTARQVTCAADTEGRLHLICAAAHHGQLGVAREWAQVHREQIAAIAGIPVDAVSSPELHVVTRHAPEVVGLHYSRLHLHLLVEQAGEVRTIALNDETNRSMDV